MDQATGKAEVTIEATVIRADGTREPLGVVSRTKVEGSALKKIINSIKKHGNSTHQHGEGADDRRA